MGGLPQIPKEGFPVQIGRYRALGPIARGGMAEVLRAEIVGPGGFRRTVALKRILPGFGKDAEFVRLFEAEARLAATLHHANVVQVLDFGADGDARYLVMELIAGHDLRRAAEEGVRQGRPLPLGLAVFVAAEVLRGLAHAHGLRDERGAPAGLIHRDVSPHNVLLSFAGEVKLSDFGIAKALDATVRSRGSAIRGKVAYMAPEQALGHRLDGRADLFALGVILYELATGTRLWGRGSEKETLTRLLGGTIDEPRRRNPAIPPSLESWLLRILDREPSDRPKGAEEALRGLIATGLIPVTASLDLGAWLGTLFPGEVAAAPPPGKGETVSVAAVGPARVVGPAPTVTFDGFETALAGPADRAITETPPVRRLARWTARGLAVGVLCGAVVALAVMAAQAPTPASTVSSLPSPTLASRPAPAPASARPPTSLSLVVRSSPPDARLLLDGVMVPGAAPWVLAVESGQAITLRAVHPGFGDRVLSITPELASGPIELDLIPAAASRPVVASATLPSRPLVAVATGVAPPAAPAAVPKAPSAAAEPPAPAPTSPLFEPRLPDPPPPPPGAAADPSRGLVAPQNL